LPPHRPIRIVRPSAVEKAAPPQRVLATSLEESLDPETARLSGTALHALLQHLGRVEPAERVTVAARALEVLLPAAPEQHAGLAAKAISILSRPDLAHIFGPDSRAELPFFAQARQKNEDIRIIGRVDRLVVEPGRVLVVDFKSDANAARSASEVNPAYLTQLGLYALVATQLFPGVAVDAAILWTSLESLLELPRDVLAEATRSFTMR
jgi:ATP-dependent helicase/nuclease subunit A